MRALEKRVSILERLLSGVSESRKLPIHARYSRATAQTINNDTWTIMDFPTVAYDTHAAVTTGASWKFTAPRTGYYLVTTYIMFDGYSGWAAGEYGALNVNKNGASVARLCWQQISATYSGWILFLGGGTILHLLKNDYIQILIYQNSGGNLTTQADAVFNWVAISSL